MKSAGFYGLDSSHEDLNSYEFFKLLLASDIFRLALLFAFFLRRIAIISSRRSMQLMFNQL